MKSFVKWMDGLPLIVKIIFAIPLLDILWVLYRLARSVAGKKTLGTVLAVVLIIVGIPFLWLLDIITLVFLGKVLWID
ncbi:MAG: hypothetical protein PHU89_02130 [Bacilli bacterium]|nr:hypothetical protein [Bacilli bacterium]